MKVRLLTTAWTTLTLIALGCSGEGLMVGADGGTLTSADGLASLTVPAGALSEDIEITITPLEEGLPENAVGVAYDFQPDGLTFAEPATLTITAAEGYAGAAAELVLCLLEESTCIALNAYTVDESTLTVSGEISHFTPYLLVQVEDADADGYTIADGDCDDADPAVNPGATEDCDGVDTDCDGTTPDDEDDVDADGWMVCEGDCDDMDLTISPGGIEECDGIDNDCDDEIDEGCGGADADGDGYVDVAEGGDDCDDTNADIHPDATEECDGVDNDCDEEIDEDCYGTDDDGDGWTVEDGDCDDTDPAVNPDATEIIGDGIDNDCDGIAE